MKKERIAAIESIEFIREIANETNKNLVLGLSGGIDSAVALALAIQAVGQDRIKVVMLPYKENQNLIDAIDLANKMKVDYEVISITDIVDAFKCDNDYRKANIMARVRMTILYERAMYHNALVLGTTNLSEYYLGYFTKWGDGAVDLEPLMHMTKTEVFAVAKYLNLPEVFLTKKPSADLWVGQTDFDELQVSYDDIDTIIDMYLNYNTSNTNKFLYEFMEQYTEKHSVSMASWNRVLLLNKRSIHKLMQIPSTHTHSKIK